MDMFGILRRRWARRREKAVFRQSPGELEPYRQRFGELKVRSVSGASLVSYADERGFAYDAYRAVQEAGNRRKIGTVAADERTVAGIVAFARSHGCELRFVLCHGTRNGAEQAMFRTHLGDGATVLGTEISSTADQFRDTIRWDFHDIRGGWLGAADLIYSNSWDHSYDPLVLFPAWAACLKPGGLMALEHTRAHEPPAISELDPFGASLGQLEEIVLSSTKGALSKAAVIDGLVPDRPDLKVIVFRRAE